MKAIRILWPAPKKQPDERSKVTVAQWAGGGVLGVFKTSAAADRFVAHHLIEYWMGNLESVDEEHGQCNGLHITCTCDCHKNEVCICKIEDPEDCDCDVGEPSCAEENPCSEHCAECQPIHFVGKDIAKEMREEFQREHYGRVTELWSEFWSTLYEWEPPEDDDSNMDISFDTVGVIE